MIAVDYKYFRTRLRFDHLERPARRILRTHLVRAAHDHQERPLAESSREVLGAIDALADHFAFRVAGEAAW